METDPAELRRQLDRAGRTRRGTLGAEKAKALTWLLDHVELVDEDGNPVSRDELAVDQGAEEDGLRATRSAAADATERGGEATRSRQRRATEEAER